MELIIPLLMFISLFGLIAFGFPVAFAMVLSAGAFGYYQFGPAAVFQLVSKTNDIATNSVLAAVPLFIFMGTILERSGIAERLFEAIQAWSKNIPGGLSVAAIALGTIFAASSGVVGATETVIGLLVIPAMMKYGYDKRLIAGTICGAGSLGTVIPPSVTVIILGPVANVSVGSLFAGLLIPGLLMAGLFVAYVVTLAVAKPEMAPRVAESQRKYSRSELIALTLKSMIPPVILIFLVLGSILVGLATPTEAAACGAAATVVMAIWYRRLSRAVLVEAMLRTASISAMILMIVLGGSMFAGMFFATGGMTAVRELIGATGLSSFGLVVMVLALAFLAGLILDLISIVLILVPIAMPIVVAAGVDPIWFCVAFLVVLQTSYLTPPMAPAIFYLRAVAPPAITLGDMYRGVLPFIGLQILTLVLVLSFPSLATWLPTQLVGPRW